MTTTHSLPDNIEACHELIAELEEENLQLRQAAALFGQLAERLNFELRQDRSLDTEDCVGSSARGV